MHKFHPKHLPYMEIVMKILCIVLMATIGFLNTSNIAFVVVLIAVLCILVVDVGLEIANFRNPKPTVLVFDRGIVANYQFFAWDQIQDISFIEEELMFKIYLGNREVVKIRFGDMKESPEQFIEKVTLYLKTGFGSKFQQQKSSIV